MTARPRRVANRDGLNSPRLVEGFLASVVARISKNTLRAAVSVVALAGTAEKALGDLLNGRHCNISTTLQNGDLLKADIYYGEIKIERHYKEHGIDRISTNTNFLRRYDYAKISTATMSGEKGVLVTKRTDMGSSAGVYEASKWKVGDSEATTINLASIQRGYPDKPSEDQILITVLGSRLQTNGPKQCSDVTIDEELFVFKPGVGVPAIGNTLAQPATGAGQSK